MPANPNKSFRRSIFALILTIVLAISLSLPALPGGAGLAQSAGLESPAGGGGGIPRVLMVAAAAFRPEQDGYTYNNAGYWLEHFSFTGTCPGCASSYFAPVHLPHGSTITGLTAYMKDKHTSKTGSVTLAETYLVNGSVSSWIATVTTPVGVVSYFSPYTQTGLSKMVDNSEHAYYLRLTVPMEETTLDQIVLGGVQISYIEGTPTNQTYFSLTAADFTPYTSLCDYTNSGASLAENSISTHDYQAGLFLPHGARVDQLKFFYHAVPSSGVSANLAKTQNLVGDYIYLGGVISPTNEGTVNGTRTTTSFADNEIDNDIYAYWVFYRMQSGPLPYGVSIQYTRRIYDSNEIYFSIPAAAFVPRHGNFTYENQGKLLIHRAGGDEDIGAYMAPFSPPQDISVDYLEFDVGNSVNSSNGEALFLSVNDELTLDSLWSVETLNTGGFYGIGSKFISGNPIDQTENMYYLRINLPIVSDTDWVHAVGISGVWLYKLYMPVTKMN